MTGYSHISAVDDPLNPPLEAQQKLTVESRYPCGPFNTKVTAVGDRVESTDRHALPAAAKPTAVTGRH